MGDRQGAQAIRGRLRVGRQIPPPASLQVHWTSRTAGTAWRTHWISPDLPDKQAERVIERQSKPPDLLVIQPGKDFTCAECGDSSGDLFTMEDAGPLCMNCADMGHLVFLPAGDAALTRRAKKATGSPPVVRWSRSRKRYERRGAACGRARA